MNDIIKDGGFKSRKLWFAVFSVLMVFAGGVCAALWPSFAPNYETFVGGVVGVAGIYLVGNVAQKWVGTKAPQKQAEPVEESP